MARIDYAVTDDWGSGFVGTMSVVAGDRAFHGWTVEFDAPFGITNLWGAELVSHVGSHYVLHSLDWNADIPVGGSASFGFQATSSAGTQATGFLVNGSAAGGDPVLPAVSVADATVTEGDNGTHYLAFTVSLSAAATGPVTVGYATADGTATAGSDYTARSGTLTFKAGQTSRVVRVAVAGDTAGEGDETVRFTVSSPAGATIADGAAIGTIVNDDGSPPPTLSIGNASFKEGSAAAPGHATFTVTLSSASSTPVTVKYATKDYTATAGSDYVAGSGRITFAPGETSKTITVAAIGDAIIEPNERFDVVLSAPVGATIADGTGAGVIRNDDKPAISIGNVSVTEGDPGAMGWLSTSGNQIVDAAGHSVQIAGVNWFGFESPNRAPDGLWARGYKDMMQQMVALGFNTIRLPFSTDMLHSTAAPGGIDYSRNPDLQGLTPLQVMDRIVDYAGQIGLRIILDHHRSEAGSGASANGLWYDGQHSEAQWVSDWQMLATRYADKPQVIGADLHNEPYNGTWGGGGATDWAAAAERAGNAIGTVNPNWLIFVEGVGTYQGQSYWWGGNLMGVKDRPIQLDVPGKLVYSAHDYPNSVYPQSWFQGSDFPANLPAKFDQMWGYIYKQNIAPVYVGEFGTKLSDPKDAPWLQALTAYLGGDLDNNGTRDIAAGKTGVSWTYWSWNPNSGDTGGILADDWTSVNRNKLAYLTPIEFDLGDAGTGTPAHADFVVSLSQPATTQVTVAYHTVTGTATAADFTGASGTLTFAVGEQSKTISIAITGDDLREANERFTVVLGNPSGATIAKGTGTATIIDDDGQASAATVLAQDAGLVGSFQASAIQNAAPASMWSTAPDSGSAGISQPLPASGNGASSPLDFAGAFNPVEGTP